VREIHFGILEIGKFGSKLKFICLSEAVWNSDYFEHIYLEEISQFPISKIPK